MPIGAATHETEQIQLIIARSSGERVELQMRIKDFSH